MPLPRIDSNIANVSMDYFLRGVDAAKPQGAPLLPEDNPPAAPEQHPAGKLVAQLDVLLMKAASASTKSLDGRTVRQTFQKLVDDGALDRNSLKLLAKTADAAAKTLKALDKFTGRELAGAFGADGRLDGTSKAGKAVAAAVRAQQDLSDLFAQLGKSLHAMSRHEDQMRAANPGFRGVDAALLNEVDDMRQLCDRRATEINHLAYQMKDFAVHLAANGENADPNVATILKTKVAELLPRQALAMHGTADALATVSEQVTGRLRPLAEKIDAFRSNPSATIGSQEFEALQGDIAAMKAAVADIRKHGIEVAGGRMMVAADILTALETEVGKAEDLFRTARTEVARTVLGNYLETTQSLFSVDEHIEFQHSNGDEKLQLALQRRNEFFESQLKKLAREIDSRNADAVYGRLLSDPGIGTDAKGRITVDASRLGDKSIVHALARVTGTQSLAIPDKIDRETYNAFLALKAGPQREAYLDSIRPRLSKASYDAAVSRLDDVIAHIEQLPADRIIENQNGRNGWLDADEAPLGTGKVTVQKNDGREKRLGGEIAKDVNEQFCPSYFARDGIDKLFA